jgi:hypothetical protein
MKSFAPRLSLLICALLASTALLAPAAHADQAIAVSPGPTSVATWGGYTMWSQKESGSGSWSLWQRTADGKVSKVPVAGANGPFQISLGPDSAGNTVALYPRCRKAASGSAPQTGCDVYRYQTKSGKEQKLSLSSSKYDEEWPVQWKDKFAFSRVGYSGSGSARIRCDVPYWRAVSGGSSHKLDRGRCGAVAGMDAQGTVVAQTVTSFGAGAQSQIRLLSTKGGPVKVAAKQTFGEETKLFGGPSLDATYVFASRYGVNPSPAFLRIRRSTMKAQYVNANTNLTGPISWPSFTYVENMGGFRGGDCDEINPCRVVRSPINPFGPAKRVLAPQATLAGPTGSSNIFPANQPLALSGTLTSKVVSQGNVTGTQPVAGAQLNLLLAAGAQGAAPYADTGVRTTTGADGSFQLAAPAPLPAVFGYGVTTGGDVPTISPQLFGNARAVITATPSATSVASGATDTFSRTLDPAQPGRSDVKLQYLSSRKCSAGACNDTWDTVADATESPDGRSYSVSAPITRSGTYTVVLPFLQGDFTAYGGRSPEIQVTVAG